MATLRGCDITNARTQEPLSIRQTSDLIQTDMGAVPVLGPRTGTQTPTAAAASHRAGHHSWTLPGGEGCCNNDKD